MKLNQGLWAGCIAMFCSAAVATSPPNYRVTILPAVDGALSTIARALNDSGEIAGDTFLGGNILIRVIYWASPDAAPIEMTGFGADTALASDINNAGTIVGSAGEGLLAFSWQPGEDLVSLDDPIACCAFAKGINDSGIIVGSSSMTGNLAAQWDERSTTSFAPLNEACCTMAEDINDQGQVVGDSDGVAVMWDGDEIIEIGGLDGLFAIAAGINESAEVVGLALQEPSGFTRPFYWNGGEIAELPLLGGLYGDATAINDAGVIVGTSAVPAVPGEVSIRATIWLDGEPFDLNELTVNLPDDAVMTQAMDINASGQIVGLISLGFETNAFFAEPLSVADLNADGSVGAVDLAILLGAWGQCPAPGKCPADLDGDGTVGPEDLAMLLGNWG
jgi:uncharacterized membrane protein